MFWIRAACTLTLAATPAILGAQQRGIGGLPGLPGRGVSREAAALAMPRIINGVNLLIQHRGDLALTDAQFTQIIALKRSLDSTNVPLMRRLDSLEQVMRPSKDPTAESNDQERRRDALAETRETVKEIYANIQPVRDRAYTLLTPDQVEKARATEERMRQLADEAASGRAGARGGRPPR